MHDDAERDVAAGSQAKGENDPFSHHLYDRPCVMGGDR